MKSPEESNSSGPFHVAYSLLFDCPTAGCHAFMTSGCVPECLAANNSLKWEEVAVMLLYNS